MKQYPHMISFSTVGAGTTDGNGDFVQGSSEVSDPLKCRYEANSKGAMIRNPDGTMVVFSGTVYMPLPVDTIAPGTVVTVQDGVEVLSKDKVLRFSRGQLNARIWL